MPTVVLPCLDEALSLPWVLGQLPAGYSAVVADNGSTDGSAEVAARLGATVVRVPQRGFGAAAHAGLLAAAPAARVTVGTGGPGATVAEPAPGAPGPGAPEQHALDPGSGDDVVCFLDADGSFDPAELPRVADPVLAGDADLVLGRRRPARWSPGARGAWPLHARLANAELARRLRRRTGVVLHDLGPMRAGRRGALLDLGLVDRRFGYPLEMVVRAAEAGWRIREVDVTYLPRTAGSVSKVTGTVRGTLRAVQDMSAVLAR